MDFTFISDTHNRHNNIGVSSTGGDIIFHSGDATSQGGDYAIKKFIEWYSSVNYKHKIFIPGNHDFGFEREYGKYSKLCEEAGIRCLNNTLVEVDGIKIYGSPATPWFYDWAFNYGRTEAESIMYKVDPIKPLWDVIPEGLDVLLTHGPPYGILDELQFIDGTPKGQWVGCYHLRDRIMQVKPKIHAFGHIHCGYGTQQEGETLHINASSLDETYSPGNEPINVKYVDGKVV